MRVVSLLPSLTEIVCALGARDCLVGRSHECDHPAGVGSLPVLTAPKFEPEGSSREIDDRVKDVVRRGLSVYAVDAERLRELRPDWVLTQDQCEVCAASLSDVEAALREWTGGAPQVLSTAPATLAEVWAQIREIGRALGRESRAAALLAELNERVTTVGERTGACARPSVACVEWVDPLMSAGNWMPELVALAGGENLFGTAGAHSPWLAWEDLRAADPEVLVVLPCGFDLPRTLEELPTLRALPGWAGLRAVRDGRVYFTDGNQYFNRPGPRLADSLEILAGMLHPELFPEQARSEGFVRLDEAQLVATG